MNLKKYKNSVELPKLVYVGRGSPWGNPHTSLDGSCDVIESIRRFECDYNSKSLHKAIGLSPYELLGCDLGCFCHPKPCHAWVVANDVNKYDDGG